MRHVDRLKWLPLVRLPAAVGVAGFLLLVTAAGCGGGARPPADSEARSTPPPEPQAAPAIDAARVVEETLGVQLSVAGELHPYQSVDIHPRVAGFVRVVNVDRGSRVRAGDVLAILEAPELLAQRAEAESRAQSASAQVAAVRARVEADLGTFERLRMASATPGVVAGNDLALAEKAVDGSRSQLAAAEQTAEAARQALVSIRQLEGYLRLTAPFAGIITERNVHPGALVGAPPAGATVRPLLRLVDQQRLRLVVPVPEAYAAGIREGGAVTFSVAAHPAGTFRGVVARVAGSVDTATRTMAVELDVDNREGALAPGEFCQVQWPVTRGTPSLFVPSSSVTSTTDRTFVVRIRDGQAEWVTVRTGLTSGPRVEVFGDLRAGDLVATRGTDEIRPGTLVRPRLPEGS